MRKLTRAEADRIGSLYKLYGKVVYRSNLQKTGNPSAAEDLTVLVFQAIIDRLLNTTGSTTNQG